MCFNLFTFFLCNTLVEIQVVCIDTSLPTGDDIFFVSCTKVSQGTIWREMDSHLFNVFRVTLVSFSIKLQRMVRLEH